MAERNKLMMILAKKKESGIKEAGDLQNRFTELIQCDKENYNYFNAEAETPYNNQIEVLSSIENLMQQGENNILKENTSCYNKLTHQSREDSTEQDKNYDKDNTLKQPHTGFLEIKIRNGNICDEENYSEVEPLYPVTGVLNETSAKVYAELKPYQLSLNNNKILQQFLPFPSVNNRKTPVITQESDFVYGNESLNDTGFNKDTITNNDNIEVFQHYEDDKLLEDDSDLDPSYDPQEPEGISSAEMKRRRLKKYFQADPNSSTEKEQHDVTISLNSSDLLNTSSEYINQNIEQAPEARTENQKENSKKRGKKRQEQIENKQKEI